MNVALVTCSPREFSLTERPNFAWLILQEEADKAKEEPKKDDEAAAAEKAKKEEEAAAEEKKKEEQERLEHEEEERKKAEVCTSSSPVFSTSLGERRCGHGRELRVVVRARSFYVSAVLFLCNAF